MPVHTDRQTLSRDLRSYGEDELAARVDALDQETLERIFDRADHYLEVNSGGLLALAVSQAAVEVMEGAPRPLKRRRRKLKGIYQAPSEDAVRAAVPAGRTETRTVAGLSRAIAARKRLAGLLRPGAQQPERPADVYAGAVEAIAEHFEADGWRYARSGPHLTQRHDPFSLRIDFASSANNSPGELVVLTVYVGVRSQELKRWRTDQQTPVRADDGVAAGPLGNLAPEPRWVDWNLADHDERGAAINDVIAEIERHALPWFDLFTDTGRLVEVLRERAIPNLNPAEAVEVLVWLGHRDGAEQHLRWWLSSPERAESFRREVKRLADRPEARDEPAADYGQELARAATAYGLRA